MWVVANPTVRAVQNEGDSLEGRNYSMQDISRLSQTQADEYERCTHLKARVLNGIPSYRLNDDPLKSRWLSTYVLYDNVR
jgi:hypothetical protein